MKVRKFEIIECPHCKYEYLPAEIYLPKYFFGNPKHIHRDVNGKIVHYDGTSIDQFEHYTCDNCNAEFRVVAKLQLTTDMPFTSCFNEEYIVPIKKDIFE